MYDERRCTETSSTCSVDNHDLIFVGLERQGGIMVFDVTDPEKPVFQDYLNNRNVCDESMEKVVEYEDDPAKNPAVPVAERVAGDVGPEGLAFIPSSQSPTGKPLLAVAHAVSGSTTMFEIVDSTCIARMVWLNIVIPLLSTA